MHSLAGFTKYKLQFRLPQPRLCLHQYSLCLPQARLLLNAPCQVHLHQSFQRSAPPKKLRAKKQSAQAAVKAGAEREFQAQYNNQQERCLARLGTSEYYGSGGFDRPPLDVYSYRGGFVADQGRYEAEGGWGEYGNGAGA